MVCKIEFRVQGSGFRLGRVTSVTLHTHFIQYLLYFLFLHYLLYLLAFPYPPTVAISCVNTSSSTSRVKPAGAS